jgi:hypothetical protein
MMFTVIIEEVGTVAQLTTRVQPTGFRPWEPAAKAAGLNC